MASVTRPFDHEATQRSVRNPLDALRTYIRRYVILEGAALTLLVMAGLFWLGLLFDFGLYKFDIDLLNVHGIDWIQELNDVDPSGGSSYWCRVILLTAFVVGLLVLGITKVVLRWVREFNDRALALVLERRFPRELGDRLITSVELADPGLSKKYGFSQAMVEKTILDAVNTLKQLPVSWVFDWGRLYRLWVYVGLSTIGVWLVLMATFCFASLVSLNPISPYGFAWRFSDVASIWTERNVLMMNTYWPRRAHLEVGRFQPSLENPSEMRVARDDARPDLQVRAIEWVIADRTDPTGWRALKWSDLPRFIDKGTLEAVTMAGDFPDWKIDPDELEPNLAAALFGTDTLVRTAAEMHDHLSRVDVRQKIAERGAQKQLDDWLDWTQWTADKIWLQMEDGDVRRSLDAEKHGYAYHQLEQVFDALKAQIENPEMSRTLRRLTIPAEVAVSFRGEETGSNAVIPRSLGNKFSVSLQDLKDSTHFRFRARGEDFFTAAKTIVLVPAPAPANITIDKEEPAYIYHRLKGVDQSPLKGIKHLTKNYALSTTGDTNTIEIPLGSDLVIHVRTDRKLRVDKSLFTKEPTVLEAGYDTFKGEKKLDADAQGFTLAMSNLTRRHDFVVEFFDEDNIRGKRRFKVLSVIDTEPQLGNLAVAGVNLRKPKVKTAAPSETEKDKGQGQEIHDVKQHAEISAAMLITPDALIPFECMVKDDYGLVRAGYLFKSRKVDFELVSLGAGKKTASQDVLSASRLLHAGAVVSALQYWPGNPASWRLAPEYITLMGAIIQNDMTKTLGYREGYVASEGFQVLLDRKDAKMVHLPELQDYLARRQAAYAQYPQYVEKKRMAQEQRERNQAVDPELAQWLAKIEPFFQDRPPQPWEFDFKEDGEIGAGFDVRKLLPELKANDPSRPEQFHYLVQISVQASDNNVETGAKYRDEKGNLLLGNTKKNKNGYLSFLVVSENELLSQIAIEEEVLLRKLENAKDKVDVGIVSVREQQAKFAGDDIALDSVLIRMNDIRTALGIAGNNLRESHQAYDNIHKEMLVNRVRPDRVLKIRDKIIDPLAAIVNQGSFGKAEETFFKALQQVETDVAAKQAPSAAAHRVNLAEAVRDMQRLSDDIKLVLDALSEGIEYRDLIQSLQVMVDRQEGRTQLLSHLHRIQVEDTLRKLLEGLDK